MSFEHVVPSMFDSVLSSNGMACFSWLKSAVSDLGELLQRLLKHYAPSAIAPDRTNLWQHVSREFSVYNISLVLGTRVFLRSPLSIAVLQGSVGPNRRD